MVNRMRAKALLGKEGTQWLLFFMYLLTRRWLYYSSTPICRAPMWDHYGCNDCIRACEHGCLEKISLGPLVVVDLFVFPLHLLSHIYSIFLYPHSSSHTSSALPWLSFLPSQVSATNHSETSHVRQLSQLSFSGISHILREFDIATICYLYVLELAQFAHE